MPELPEVETICRGLEPKLVGSTITTAKANTPKLRVAMPSKLEQKLKNKKIVNISRRAKYIIIELDDEQSLVIHLGMSGRVTVTKNYQAKKHDHLVLKLSNGHTMALNDPRRFGLVALIPTTEIDSDKLFVKLGVEPLSNKFNGAHLAKLIQKRHRDIKSCIMDASLVVGVGNIYASESLYLSKIHPERKASNLSKKECEELSKSIKQTLKAAIKAGGSSLRDYRQADGEMGYFQHSFKVYDCSGQPCGRCKTTIERIRQAGRSTYLCSKCQK
jgi:formamidopyrimidine-DNA glycosylase